MKIVCFEHQQCVRGLGTTKCDFHIESIRSGIMRTYYITASSELGIVIRTVVYTVSLAWTFECRQARCRCLVRSNGRSLWVIATPIIWSFFKFHATILAHELHQISGFHIFGAGDVLQKPDLSCTPHTTGIGQPFGPHSHLDYFFHSIGDLICWVTEECLGFTLLQMLLGSGNWLPMLKVVWIYVLCVLLRLYR